MVKTTPFRLEAKHAALGLRGGNIERLSTQRTRVEVKERTYRLAKTFFPASALTHATTRRPTASSWVPYNTVFLL